MLLSLQLDLNKFGHLEGNKFSGVAGEVETVENT